MKKDTSNKTGSGRNGAGIDLTEATVETFTVQIKLDAWDRIKLGLLASNAGETPERFLEECARAHFSRCADALEKRGAGARQKALFDSCAILEMALHDCMVSGENGRARLMFKPAVMA